MRLERNRALVLTALIVLLLGAASFMWNRTAGAPTQAVEPRKVRDAAKPAAPQAAVADLRLERLRGERDPLSPSSRDLFRFRPVAPPPDPARAPRVAPPVMLGPQVPPPLPGPPPPPPIPLKFIGIVNAPAQGGRVAVLSDARGDVFYGKEGDIIDGRYRVLKLSAESAELAYLDGRGRQTLRLSGQ